MNPEPYGVYALFSLLIKYEDLSLIVWKKMKMKMKTDNIKTTNDLGMG